jgi:predicted nucleic acid-binding protein
VIYLDSSVALARLLDEFRSPPDAFWQAPLVSSRLLEFEVFNRIHSRPDWTIRSNSARQLIDRIQLLELSPAVLARALQPFPVSLRTLDALHLATMDFLRAHGQTIELATYDQRLTLAAQAFGFSLVAI